MPTPLEILEIKTIPTTERELTKIYRKLSLKYHPDKCDEPNAKTRFQDISNAYQTLLEGLKKAGNLGNFYYIVFVLYILFYFILLFYF